MSNDDTAMINWVTAILTLVFVFILFFHIFPEEEKCESSGGDYVRTVIWYECINKEE